MIGSDPEDPPVTMTVKCLEFFSSMTIIVTFIQAISENIADIGRYPAILGCFLVMSNPLCVGSWPNQVVQGQLIISLIWSGRVGYVSLQYRSK